MICLKHPPFIRGDQEKEPLSMNITICEEAQERFAMSKHFRIVLFGASNTERYAPFLHWGDILETALLQKYGRKFHVINSGYSGSNTREANGRFSYLVEDFKPDVVIITFGGNDANSLPERYVPEEEYKENLRDYIKKIRAMGGIPILQTYYKPDLNKLIPLSAQYFVRYMEVIRLLAEEEKVFLVDQYSFFEKVDDMTLFYKLLLNPMHLNEAGNCLMGVNLAYHLGLHPEKILHNEKLLPAIALYQKIMEG